MEESDKIILYHFFFMQTISAFGEVLVTDHNEKKALKYGEGIVKIDLCSYPVALKVTHLNLQQ